MTPGSKEKSRKMFISLNKTYKGLTESVVKEAFGWNDDFMRPGPEQK